MRRSPIWIVCVLAVLGVGCAPEGTTAAYVDANMKVDSSCVVSADGDLSVPIGLYDIAEAGMGNSNAASRPCANSYLMNLRLVSSLRPGADPELGRAETNVLQIDRAEVELMTLNKEPLGFTDSDDNPDSTRPNPFMVVTAATLEPALGAGGSSAIATIEAIPAAYASGLAQFIDDKILVKVQVFGKTTGGVEVEFKPFEYAIDICEGCLTFCRMADILTPGILEEDVIGDECSARNLSGMDGRACIDPEC